MFISSQSKLCIWSKNFVDKSCFFSTSHPIKFCQQCLTLFNYVHLCLTLFNFAQLCTNFVLVFTTFFYCFKVMYWSWNNFCMIWYFLGEVIFCYINRSYQIIAEKYRFCLLVMLFVVSFFWGEVFIFFL